MIAYNIIKCPFFSMANVLQIFYNLKWPSSNIDRYMLFVDEGAKRKSTKTQNKIY
jgi:hypothetical protein